MATMSEEQRQARLAQIKRQWEQRRAISRSQGKIKTKIGVYSAKAASARPPLPSTSLPTSLRKATPSACSTQT